MMSVPILQFSVEFCMYRFVLVASQQKAEQLYHTTYSNKKVGQTCSAAETPAKVDFGEQLSLIQGSN